MTSVFKRGNGDAVSHQKRLRNDSNSSANSSNSSCSLPRSTEQGRPHRQIERDPAVLARRQKQIDFGKNTLSYQQYTAAVPRNEREAHHPRTPRKQWRMGRRGWDTLVKNWKIHVHMWKDPEAREKLRQRRLQEEQGCGDGAPACARAASACDQPAPSQCGDTAGDDTIATTPPAPPAAGDDTDRKQKRKCVDSDADEKRTVTITEQADSSLFDNLADFSWADDVEELARLMD